MVSLVVTMLGVGEVEGFVEGRREGLEVCEAAPLLPGNGRPLSLFEKSPLVFAMSLLEDDLLVLVEGDGAVAVEIGFVDERRDRETDGDVAMSGAASSKAWQVDDDRNSNAIAKSKKSAHIVTDRIGCVKSPLFSIGFVPTQAMPVVEL